MKSTRLILTLFILGGLGLTEVKASGEPSLIAPDVNDLANGGPATQPAVAASTPTAKPSAAPVAVSTTSASSAQPAPATNSANNSGNAEQAAGNLNGLFHGASTTGEALAVTPTGTQASTTTATVRSVPTFAASTVPPKPRHEIPVEPIIANATPAPAAPTAAPAITPSTATVQGSTANKTAKTEEKSDTRWGFLASHGLLVAGGIAVGAMYFGSLLLTLGLGVAGYLAGDYLYDQLKDSKGDVNGWAIAGAILGAAVLGGVALGFGYLAGFSLFEKIVLGLAGAVGGFVITYQAVTPTEKPPSETKPTPTT